jgi:serine/threonine protein kinase
VGIFELGAYSLYEHARFERPVRLVKTKLIMEDVLEGLSGLHDNDIVHCDLKPENIMFFRTSTHYEGWKLIDLDSAVPVGDVVTHGTLTYCAPEVMACVQASQPALATTALDLFAIGRILQWLSSLSTASMWPEEMDEETQRAFLADLSRPFGVTEANVPHAPTRKVIHALLCKDPLKRMTLKQLRESSFIRMNLDTAALHAPV